MVVSHSYVLRTYVRQPTAPPNPTKKAPTHPQNPSSFPAHARLSYVNTKNINEQSTEQQAAGFSLVNMKKLRTHHPHNIAVCIAPPPPPPPASRAPLQILHPGHQTTNDAKYPGNNPESEQDFVTTTVPRHASLPQPLDCLAVHLHLVQAFPRYCPRFNRDGWWCSLARLSCCVAVVFTLLTALFPPSPRWRPSRCHPPS